MPAGVEGPAGLRPASFPTDSTAASPSRVEDGPGGPRENIAPAGWGVCVLFGAWLGTENCLVHGSPEAGCTTK